MIKAILPTLLLMLSLQAAAQQATTSKVKARAFLSAEELPQTSRFIADPPQPGSGAFENDRFYYYWGKELRDTERGRQASIDEDQEPSETFSAAVGFAISADATPAIYKLAEGARIDARTANGKAKDYYRRTRPFVNFHEPSINPSADKEYETSWSYPSGHTVRGWVYALTLALVVPDSTEALVRRAEEFALSRVICGRHWKSDTEASLIEATAVMSRLQSNKAFVKQLKKARKEYARLRRHLKNNGE